MRSIIDFVKLTDTDPEVMPRPFNAPASSSMPVSGSSVPESSGGNEQTTFGLSEEVSDDGDDSSAEEEEPHSTRRSDEERQRRYEEETPRILEDMKRVAVEQMCDEFETRTWEGTDSFIEALEKIRDLESYPPVETAHVAFFDGRKSLGDATVPLSTTLQELIESHGMRPRTAIEVEQWAWAQGWLGRGEFSESTWDRSLHDVSTPAIAKREH